MDDETPDPPATPLPPPPRLYTRETKRERWSACEGFFAFSPRQLLLLLLLLPGPPQPLSRSLVCKTDVSCWLSGL